METRAFDLNIEQVLEHWTVAHAIREIVANALDEQALTGTDDPQISQIAGGWWLIRDWGRGIRYQNLTQNENDEKLSNRNLVIGKFGVGLKDALATFQRHKVQVHIDSRFSAITIKTAPKPGFSDVLTLHAIVSPPREPERIGTAVFLRGVTSDEIAEAKSFFLRYSDETVLDSVSCGQIIMRPKNQASARIYVNGLRIAEEGNFLFSYNITSPTGALLKAMNRERTNVGRAAYSERVKTMLLGSSARSVATQLASDLENMPSGESHDEVKWIDVASHAVRILNSSGEVVFATTDEVMNMPTSIGHLRDSGLRVVIVPENVRTKLPSTVDIQQKPIRDMTVWSQEWNKSFVYSFVSPSELSHAELSVWNLTHEIVKLAGGRPGSLQEILISEALQADPVRRIDRLGVWEPHTGRIIVKRSELRSVASFASVLLHELVHAQTGYDDLSFGFVDGLTQMLGRLASPLLVN